jgi:hypothetical protein
VGVPAQLRRTSRGASLWVRGAGELLPASALVAEHHSSPRGSAATGWLRRCCEGIPGCEQADGMGSFSGQHLDLDVTRGAPRFHDAVRALVGAAQEAAGVPDKIFYHPDKHPEPLARGEGDLHLLVRHPVASDVHGGLVVRKAATGSGMILEGDPAERLART